MLFVFKIRNIVLRSLSTSLQTMNLMFYTSIPWFCSPICQTRDLLLDAHIHLFVVSGNCTLKSWVLCVVFWLVALRFINYSKRHIIVGYSIDMDVLLLNNFNLHKCLQMSNTRQATFAFSGDGFRGLILTMWFWVWL